MNPERPLSPVRGILVLVVVLALNAGCANSTVSPAAPTPLAADEVYDVHSLDRAPRPRSQAWPVYPGALRRAGISGQVSVEFIVDQNGNVRNAHAMSATNDEFADAAVQCISQWIFVPGMKNGEPVNTVMRVPLVFSSNPEG